MDDLHVEMVVLVGQKVVFAPPLQSEGGNTHSQEAFGFEPMQVW